MLESYKIFLFLAETAKYGNVKVRSLRCFFVFLNGRVLVHCSVLFESVINASVRSLFLSVALPFVFGDSSFQSLFLSISLSLCDTSVLLSSLKVSLSSHVLIMDLSIWFPW